MKILSVVTKAWCAFHRKTTAVLKPSPIAQIKLPYSQLKIDYGCTDTNDILYDCRF